MHKSKNRHIFFHVGTGKTGTTFLQYRVFPKFKGVYYIQRTRYRKAEKIIKKAIHKKILISCEFDQQLEYEVKAFSALFPDTTPIIVFRRQDSYIASQYRRFVKNGFPGSFRDFFDVENDRGYFRHRDLDYHMQINLLKHYFRLEPVVLLYDDLRTDPKKFVKHLANITGSSVDIGKINFNRKHTSYNEKQLKVMHAVSKRINMRKRRIFNSGILHLIWRLYMGAIRYSLLYIASVIPEKFINPDPLISKGELEKIRERYHTEWENLRQTYAIHE